ncbi:MAG: hypothetical protein ACD_37C00380G0001 [uncultured bacterium]|nr:MAG: hypothetical protein ACD_37C00380G0001 [uncultured bacterium]
MANDLMPAVLKENKSKEVSVKQTPFSNSQQKTLRKIILNP